MSQSTAAAQSAEIYGRVTGSVESTYTVEQVNAGGSITVVDEGSWEQQPATLFPSNPVADAKATLERLDRSGDRVRVFAELSGSETRPYSLSGDSAMSAAEALIAVHAAANVASGLGRLIRFTVVRFED